IVVLNDNEMSIAPPVGALSAHLVRLLTSQQFLGLRELGKSITELMPSPIAGMARRAETLAKELVHGPTIFDSLGFDYVGPVDGPNLDQLVPVVRNVKEMDAGKPVLVHAVTRKGKGYAPAEASADKYHGVVKFDVITGKQAKAVSNAPSYTNVFAKALIAQAEV